MLDSFVQSPSPDQAVAQRFEAKYLVDEVRHVMIEDYIRTFTRADEHSATYPVTSVYFDDARWTTFRSSYFGEKNRFKLRVRSYDASGTLYSCEVKRRTGSIVQKSRALVRRSALPRIADRQTVRDEDFVDPGDQRSRAAMMNFEALRHSLNAEPSICVRYLREAHISRFDEPVRVTFDTRIEACRMHGALEDFYTQDQPWRRLSIPTVLEIKFTDRYPGWVYDLIQRFELNRISLAKYVNAVQALANEGVIAGAESQELPAWAN